MGKRTRNFMRDVILILIICGIASLFLLRWYRGTSTSNDFIREWLTEPESYPDYETTARLRCGDVPFIIPSEGFIGLLWRDTSAPYNVRNRHTGVDIFGAGAVGTVPIYAAYDGYLTRLEDWQATVIIRHDDPLQEGRRIWTYYTHMASKDGSDIYISDAFPQGTSDEFVTQGTLLGYQGLYNPPFPIAMHLHFSIVTSETNGWFKNEAILTNTLDPSPYLGVEVNSDDASRPVTCNKTSP